MIFQPGVELVPKYLRRNQAAWRYLLPEFPPWPGAHRMLLPQARNILRLPFEQALHARPWAIARSARPAGLPLLPF